MNTDVAKQRLNRVLDELLSRYPEYESRIVHGLELVDTVEETFMPDLHLVISKNAPVPTAYQVDSAACSCPDFQLAGNAFCKHRAARAFYLAMKGD